MIILVLIALILADPDCVWSQDIQPGTQTNEAAESSETARRSMTAERMLADERIVLDGILDERVWLRAKLLADGGRSRWQWTGGPRPVAIAFARHRALATKVESTQRVYLPGVRRPDGHAVLLLDIGIRCRPFHAAKLDRRSGILVEIRQQR